MKFLKPLFLFWAFLNLYSCAPGSSESQNASPSTPTVAETSLCSISSSYSPSVTITGSATFYKRGLTVSKSAGVVTQMTLSSPTSTALPIKYAEIQILNAAGTVVQCGKTNASGALKALDGTSNLTIPSSAGTYTVQVLSRANHTVSVGGGKTAFKFLTSIKKDIYSNELYKVSGSIFSSGSGSYSVSLVAYARESESPEVLGGAFNIYNSLAVAYDYLAQNTGTSNLTCLNPKLEVFWKAGFNPAQYIYPSADPNDLGTVSFYVRGENQLYINGGVQGNVSMKDTDHFDDTVIIHELGHHVEDVCGKMDSPGGVHYGLYRIDPRFAWSEGWGNFFGAHIVSNNISALNPDLSGQLSSGVAATWNHYLDTEGYNDAGVTSGISLIILNLSKAGSNPESVGGGRYYDKVDASTYPGEGHTREVSISRSLFKGTNTCASTCVNTNHFADYWKAFENDPAGGGMGKANYPFRSSARFYSRLNAVAPGIMTSIDAVLDSDEAQQRDGNSSYTVGGHLVWPAYGIKLINNGSTPCTIPVRIQPRQEVDTVTDGFSDHRYSNHYYLVDPSVLSGVTQIILTATKVAGTNTDIDLILYKDGFRFNQDCTTDSMGSCVSWAKDTTSSDMVRQDRSIASTPGTSFTKTITSIDGLSISSYYMLDVRAYTANKTILNTTSYTYTLTTQSGAYLCPSATY